MNKWLFLALLLPSTASADIVSTFEDIALAANSYKNDAGASGYFVSAGNSFNNSFNTTYGTFAGWAISSATDTTTPGYTNQYSAVTGTGFGGSSNYAVGFTDAGAVDPFHPDYSYVNLAAGTSPYSVEVTNTTYAYLTMLHGDPYGFVHPFKAGDFLTLTVTGYSGLNGVGATVGPEVDFSLADFRNGKSSIVDTWQGLDLTSLKGARSLRFGLDGSQNDPTYGLLIPAYFAVDNFTVRPVAAVPEPPALALLAVGAIGLAARLRRERRADILDPAEVAG